MFKEPFNWSLYIIAYLYMFKETLNWSLYNIACPHVLGTV